MIENLDYNLNRLLIGITIISVLFISYFLNLDLFLFSTVIILIFYELYKSVIKNKIIITSLFILFIFATLVSHFLISISTFILLITLFSLLCSIYFDRYFNIFFALFVIHVFTLIFNLSTIDRNIIYIIISISFLNDTIAYIAGSYFKGSLITPRISPNKTWSGTSVSFLITSFLFIYFEYNLFISPLLAISLFFGDIYFSFIKRKLEIKDFSRMLSTHGGILDRIDSITFLIIIFTILNL